MPGAGAGVATAPLRDDAAPVATALVEGMTPNNGVLVTEAAVPAEVTLVEGKMLNRTDSAILEVVTLFEGMTPKRSVVVTEAAVSEVVTLFEGMTPKRGVEVTEAAVSVTLLEGMMLNSGVVATEAAVPSVTADLLDGMTLNRGVLAIRETASDADATEVTARAQWSSKSRGKAEVVRPRATRMARDEVCIVVVKC